MDKTYGRLAPSRPCRDCRCEAGSIFLVQSLDEVVHVERQTPKPYLAIVASRNSGSTVWRDGHGADIASMSLVGAKQFSGGMSHNRTLLSALADRNAGLFGQKIREATSSLWPTNRADFLMRLQIPQTDGKVGLQERIPVLRSFCRLPPPDRPTIRPSFILRSSHAPNDILMALKKVLLFASAGIEQTYCVVWPTRQQGAAIRRETDGATPAQCERGGRVTPSLRRRGTALTSPLTTDSPVSVSLNDRLSRVGHANYSLSVRANDVLKTDESKPWKRASALVEPALPPPPQLHQTFAQIDLFVLLNVPHTHMVIHGVNPLVVLVVAAEAEDGESTARRHGHSIECFLESVELADLLATPSVPNADGVVHFL